MATCALFITVPVRKVPTMSCVCGWGARSDLRPPPPQDVKNANGGDADHRKKDFVVEEPHDHIECFRTVQANEDLSLIHI